MTEENSQVGMVLGTESSTPLEWWVAIAPDAHLQLDDIVSIRTVVSGDQEVQIYGVVDLVRARHEGSSFESDVFLADQGVLPLKVARSARVITTRVEPEVWVPPRPGDAVFRVAGPARDLALHFDRMEERLAAGFSRDGLPVYLDLSFLDGRRGAHVNISGVSGIATKTSYASFLLFSLFSSGILGHEAANTKALIFNVKGEDLLFLDHANKHLSAEDRERYGDLGLKTGAFQSVGIWAPVKRGQGNPVPDTGSRQRGVRPYFWTVRDVVRDGLLRFMFAEAGDERSQVADLIARVESLLARHAEDDPDNPGTITFRGESGTTRIRSFDELCAYVTEQLMADDSDWVRYTSPGTVAAFVRRLDAARYHLGHLIKGAEASEPDAHKIDWEDRQVSVIDIHNLHDRAKRFVVGVIVKRLFEHKEATGSARPLVFLVLDELNKYASNEGWSPIKEVLLDIAERGRSLGVILIGAQQTASEVERRVVANSAIRIVGRLDPAEALRPEYGFLSATTRQRAAILRPGSMILQQPHMPVPIEVAFPFPSWATRRSEAAESADAKDPFERFGK